YVVESSIGHIRDMPDKAAEIPQKYRGEAWARLGVDVDRDFQALYVVPSDKKQQISKLKALLKDADELYLATDEDREGEAIAWHLLDELKPKNIPVKRMVFHEITKSAIQAAAENPRELDMDLVEAQETRRILDHLYRGRAEGLVAALAETAYAVRSVESRPYRRSPYAPFRTTTLQQEASRKLGMSASVTMSVAQRLYENGFITYMRTDSTSLSETAVSAARAQARELYGAEYVPDKPRTYASKVKNAQEAHEAVRPAGENFRTPAQTG